MLQSSNLGLGLYSLILTLTINGGKFEGSLLPGQNFKVDPFCFMFVEIS